MRKELSCSSLIIGLVVAFIIFTIFPPSFLLAIPIIGGMLFNGALKATTRVVANAVEDAKEENSKAEAAKKLNYANTNNSNKTSKKKDTGRTFKSVKTKLNRAKQIMADRFGVPLEEITPEKNFITDLGADSLDLVEMTMEMESEFDAVVSDEELENIETVGQALQLIKDVLTKQSSY